MGIAAIFVMWPGPFEQTFVPLSQGGSIWNLASIGTMVSEEKMFIWKYWHIHTYIRTTETCLYFKLTYEPGGSGELKTLQKWLVCCKCAQNIPHRPHLPWMYAFLQCPAATACTPNGYGIRTLTTPTTGTGAGYPAVMTGWSSQTRALWSSTSWIPPYKSW